MIMCGIKRSTPTHENFIGDLDEFRLEGEPRSAEWIKACYDDQRGGLTLISFHPAGTMMIIR